MNQKTNSFLNALVNLCVSHGVKIAATNGILGFSGNGVKALPVSSVAESLAAAFADHRDTGNMVFIFRDDERLGRRWLHAEKQWRKDRGKVGVKCMSLPQAKRLIRAFKKSPAGGRYVYGFESVFGRDRVVIG